MGGGQGGFQTAASLRAEGFHGSITLIGEENHLPYQRPPLSKGMLLGKQAERHAILRPAEFYGTHRVELITGQRVVNIDREARRVLLHDERGLPYDVLVLATGARNRPLPVAGAEHALYLRTLRESDEIKHRLDGATKVAVIGGGFIGLEVAAAARTLGKKVTVIEALPRLMARVVAPVVSGYFRVQHETRGVRILFGAMVASLDREGVVLSDGKRVAADLIVAGIGVIPNDSLARDAGLAVGNGIVVDEFLRTSDPSIYAIGDCAEYPNAFAGARVRLESVQNAVDQAACVARAITGKPAKYEAAPWFWSDQFDIHLQMAGLSMGADHTVTRGDPSTNKFSTFYYKGGELKAIDSINRPAEHMIARKLIAARVSMTPEQAADESFDLKAATLSK